MPRFTDHALRLRRAGLEVCILLAQQRPAEAYRQHATAVVIAQGAQELALLRRYQEAALKALLNL